MEDSSESRPKYEALVEEYATAIQSGLPPGALLPSARKMAQIHDVSLGTVQQAMACLREMGLVESRPRRGYVVADHTPPERGQREIGLAMVGGSEYLPHVIGRLHEFLEAMSSANPVDLRLWSGHKEQGRHLVEWTEKLDGLLLWGHVDSGLISACCKRVKACVVVGSIDDGRCPPTAGHVNWDTQGGVTLAVSHLQCLGHRRIALLHGGGHRDDEKAAEAFDRLASHNNGATLHRIALDANSVDVDREELLPRIRELPHRPTAFLVVGRRLSICLIESLEESGVSVPDDASIMRLGGPKTPHGEVRFTRVDSGTEMVCRSVELLAEMMDGAPPARERLQPLIEFGNTCAPPPPSA